MRSFKNNWLPRANRLLLSGALIVSPLSVVRAESQTPPKPATAPLNRLAVVQAALQIGLAYREWNQAVERKNPSGLTQWGAVHHTADYTFKKLVGRSENSLGLEGSPNSQLPPMKVISRLTVRADTATAFLNYRFRDNIADLKVRTDLRDRENAQRDDWVITPRGWKLKSSELLPAGK